MLLGVQAIAFSQVINSEEPSYEKQKPYIAEVLRLLTRGRSSPGWSMSISPRSSRDIADNQSVRAYNGKVVEGQDPMGRKHYWFSAIPLTEPDENSDRWAIENDLVSLTPLRLDLTDEAWLEKEALLQAN